MRESPGALTCPARLASWRAGAVSPRVISNIDDELQGIAMLDQIDATLSRRDLLKATAAGAAGLIACGTHAAAAAEKDPYGGLKMGMQSYSLRGFKAEQA